MTQQWLRKAELIVGDDAGNALDLSALHITFSVHGATTQTLKRATVRVYNLAQDTINRVQREFTRFTLQAGYDGGIGQIFSGSITKIKRGRENATDSFLELEGADGDKVYNWGVVSTTLAAGWTYQDKISALAKAMESYGILMGVMPPLPSTKGPAGITMYGMVRDHLRQTADAIGCDWNIHDGRLNFIPKGGYLTSDAIVLSPSTGMVGVPELTMEGIVVKCLLNPNIKAGMRVQIDNSFITDTVVKKPMQPQTQDIKMPTLDARGVYKVLYVVNNGDTRGQTWYTEMICSAIDGTAPLSGPVVNAVPEVTH